MYHTTALETAPLELLRLTLEIDREEMNERLAKLSRAGTWTGYLQRECLALLCEHLRDRALPTSIRFLFYELVSREIIPKQYERRPDGRKAGRTPGQDISNALTVLREAELIPWAWIVDETRVLDAWSYADTVADYLRDRSQEARIDLWDDTPPPLILCESRSLRGVLRRIAARYLCPIAATGGQTSGFLRTDIGPLVREGWMRWEMVRPVLYFGDLDLSGGHIEDNTRRVLEDFGPLDWTRLAITAEHVHDNALTAIDKEDKRFKPPRSFPAVETEALTQLEIQRILTERLDAILPEPLEDVLEREQRQREHVHQRLQGEDE